MTGPGQRAHGLTVGALAPGLEGDLAAGEGKGLYVVAMGLVVVGQLLERPERLLVESLALDHHPFLEGGTVEGEAVEEIAAVEVGGCLQLAMQAGQSISEAWAWARTAAMAAEKAWASTWTSPSGLSWRVWRVMSR